MAEGGVFNTLKSVVECDMCYELMIKPRALECKHHFCLDCIDDMMETNQEGHTGVNCPKCHQFTPENNVHSSFLMNDLVDIYIDHKGDMNQGQKEISQGRNEISQGHNEISQGHSEMSQGHNKMSQGHDKVKRSPGHTEMNQGHNKMSQGHNEMSQGRNNQGDSHDDKCQGDNPSSECLLQHRHVSLPLVKGSAVKTQEINECIKHPGHSVEYNCKRCNKAGCAECMLKDHNGHVTESIEEALDTIVTSTREQMDIINKHQEKIKERLDEIEKSMDKCVKNNDNIKNDIEERTEEVLMMLRADSAHLLEIVDNHAKKKLRELETAKSELESELASQESLLSWTNTVINMGKGPAPLCELQGGLYQRVQSCAKQTMTIDVNTDINLAKLNTNSHVAHSNLIGDVKFKKQTSINNQIGAPSEKKFINDAEVINYVKFYNQAETIDGGRVNNNLPAMNGVGNQPDVKFRNHADNYMMNDLRNQPEVKFRNHAENYIKLNKPTQTNHDDVKLSNQTLINDGKFRESLSAVSPHPHAMTRHIVKPSYITPKVKKRPYHKQIVPVRRYQQSFRQTIISFQKLTPYNMKELNSFQISRNCGRLAYINDTLWCWYDNDIDIYSTEGRLLHTIHNNVVLRPLSVHPQTDQHILVATETGLYRMTTHGLNVAQFLSGNFIDVHVNREVIGALEYVRNGEDKVHILDNNSDLPSKHTLFNVVDKFPSYRLLVIDKHVYVSFTEHIRRYTMRGEKVGKYGHFGTSGPGLLRYPRLCGWDTDGSILVADFYNHRLQVLDTEGKWRVMIPPGWGQYKFPRDIVVIPNGTIYTLLYHENGKRYIEKCTLILKK